MTCPGCGISYLVHSSSSGTEGLSCIYLVNEAIISELLRRACRLRSARDTNAAVAALTAAATVATAAAAAAAVDTDYLSRCASIVQISATNVMFIVQVDY